MTLPRIAGPLDALLMAAERLFLVLANTCLALMLLMNMFNIGWRAVTDRNINFVWPWTGLLFVWMCFFGFFVIYRRSHDITVDFFVDLIGPKARHFTRIMSDLIIIGLMMLLLIEAPRTLESQVGSMELIALERYWMSVPLFVSAALVGLHFLRDLIGALAGEPERRKHFDAAD
jgi:TRAP-type C4-dicarboxylate transport system permease small subunit